MLIMAGKRIRRSSDYGTVNMDIDIKIVMLAAQSFFIRYLVRIFLNVDI